MSTLLASFGVDHGYSTRWFGDMRTASAREKFLDGRIGRLILAEQVHGVRIKRVNESDAGKIMEGYDGLVGTGVLGVTFADCVPLLAFDPKTRTIGTAHAGWKGTLAGIAKELIRVMEQSGADRGSIVVSMGPHIGMCCYAVLPDRVHAFQNAFGENERIASRIEGAWHLDIGYANYLQLEECGIDPSRIDAPVTCTSCQVAEFNSFRKDPKESFGVQLAFVSI